jgi:hypothetical protein
LPIGVVLYFWWIGSLGRGFSAFGSFLIAFFVGMKNCGSQTETSSLVRQQRDWIKERRWSTILANLKQ